MRQGRAVWRGASIPAWVDAAAPAAPASATLPAASPAAGARGRTPPAAVTGPPASARVGPAAWPAARSWLGGASAFTARGLAGAAAAAIALRSSAAAREVACARGRRHVSASGARRQQVAGSDRSGFEDVHRQRADGALDVLQERFDRPGCKHILDQPNHRRARARLLEQRSNLLWVGAIGATDSLADAQDAQDRSARANTL